MTLKESEQRYDNSVKWFEWTWFTILLVVLCAGLVASCEAASPLKEKATVTEETNSWDWAVSLYNKGEYTKGLGIYTWGTVSMATNNCITLSSYSSTVIFSCGKTHTTEWPKSNDVVQAVQKVITTDIYRGTNLLSSTLQYEYPHKKITTTTTETLKIETNVVTKVEQVTKGQQDKK